MIQLASSNESVFRVLVSRRHVIRRDSTTLAYGVECFLSLPLNSLVTLSSCHFTRGKIVSECDITFEWYRIVQSNYYFTLSCLSTCVYTEKAASYVTACLTSTFISNIKCQCMTINSTKLQQLPWLRLHNCVCYSTLEVESIYIVEINLIAFKNTLTHICQKTDFDTLPLYKLS